MFRSDGQHLIHFAGCRTYIPSKRTGSWKSMPTLRRRVSTSKSKISRPSRKTDPAGGSHKRLRALNSVDFPLPLGPIMPIIEALAMSTETPFRIKSPASDTLLRSLTRNFGSPASASTSTSNGWSSPSFPAETKRSLLITEEKFEQSTNSSSYLERNSGEE